MYERFTDRARKVLQLANQEAHRLNHEYVGTAHLLLGLVKEGQGVAAHVLTNLGIDLGRARREVEKSVRSCPGAPLPGKLPQTPRAKKVIEYAIEEARNLNHQYVGTEHLLLGLLREREGVASQILRNLGLELEGVCEEVLRVLNFDGAPPRNCPRHGRAGLAVSLGPPRTYTSPGPAHPPGFRVLAVSLGPPRTYTAPRRRPRQGRAGLAGSLGVFAGGLLSTFAGAFLGAGCCPERVDLGAWLAGYLYLAAVALAHRASPR